MEETAGEWLKRLATAQDESLHFQELLKDQTALLFKATELLFEATELLRGLAKEECWGVRKGDSVVLSCGMVAGYCLPCRARNYLNSKEIKP